VRPSATPMIVPLFVALLLRLVCAWGVQSYVDNAGRQFLIEGDANGYWELGQRIARGEPYAIHQPPRYVLRTPGFPLLLAGSITVFGDSVPAARVVLAVVGTLSCLLVWQLGRVFADRTTAIIALWIAALSPLHVGMSPLILSETVFGLGVLGCLLLLSPVLDFNRGASDRRDASTRRVTVRSTLAGICCGLTVLIRPGWLPAVFVAIAFLLTRSATSCRIRVRAGSLFLLGVTVALLPWVYRNHAVTGHWVVTSLWAGPSLYDGLNPTATGGSDMTFVDEDGLYASLTEYEANSRYTQKAIAFATQHPARVAQLAIVKAGRFLSPFLSASAVAAPQVNLPCLLWYTIFTFATLLGGYQLRQQRFVLLFLLWPLVQFLLVHMVFVGSVRYRLPVELPLAVLAAVGVRRLLGKWVK
jgi:4-amino-4-deoxy-L-arabinose transferase-like glycosyltransferase